MKSELIFQSSPYFIILCLAVGVLYAWLLYHKQPMLSQWQQRGLAALRTILVSTLCFLLLNPLLRSQQQRSEQPRLVVALDNSTSMLANRKDFTATMQQALGNFVEKLAQNGITADIRTLNASQPLAANQLQTLKFDSKTTNLGKLLSGLKSAYEGDYLTDVVVISDGIQNTGLSPLGIDYDFKVHTIGVGDTTQPRDVRVIGVYANQLAYLGNSFPIEAEVSGVGYGNQAAVVVLKSGSNVVAKQSVRFRSDNDIQRVKFTTTAQKVGMARFSVQVLPLLGEKSARNNEQETTVEVIDGKEKILLFALAPHPDIKAIKTILEKNARYEVTIRLLSDAATPANADFDLLLLHQLPDINGLSASFLPSLLAKNKPTFFLLGSQTNISSFNGLQEVIGISPIRGRMDQVTPKVNLNFKRFQLNTEQLGILARFPYVHVPFGDYRIAPQTEVILFQQLGNVATQRPLLLINTQATRKAAVLTGEGFWRWRLEEFDLTKQQNVVDEILLKTIQLLAVKEDKRKLRVYPTAHTYHLDDPVVVETEVYDAIYERLYNQQIALTVQAEKGAKRTFTYTISPERSSYQLSDLPPGNYSFRATTTVNGKTETAEGQFSINNQSVEELNTTANFSLLRTLAAQNGGKFVVENQLLGLADYIVSTKSPARLSANEAIEEIINQKWLLPLLLLLVALEWGMRKYLGL